MKGIIDSSKILSHKNVFIFFLSYFYFTPTHLENMIQKLFTTSLEKFMKKTNILILTVAFLFVSSNGYAYHEISEILNDNKIIVCRNHDEEIVGNKLIIKKEISSRSPNKRYVISSEHVLPKNGENLNLYHRQVVFTQGRNKKIEFFNDFIGTATITDKSIVGDKYITYIIQHSRQVKVISKEIIINAEDAIKIKNNCLVAIPNFQLNSKDQISVVF
jgi:hypothetical protein